MTGALGDYRSLFRTACLRRFPRAGKWVPLVAACGAALAVLLAQLVHAGVRGQARAGTGTACGLLLFGVLICFMPGAVLLNTPANARLLPRARRRLVEITVALWACALMLFVAFTGLWHVMPLAGAYIIGLTLVCGGRLVGTFFLWFALVPYRVISEPATDALTTTPMTVAGMVIVFALGAYALRALFPNGGERHFRRAAALKTGVMPLGAAATPAARVSWPGLWLHAQAMRQALRAGDPGSLLLYVLGPSAHWTVAAVPALVMLAVGVGGKAALVAYARPYLRPMMPILFIVLALFLLLLVLMAAQMMQRMRATRTEQALVRLAARSPAAPDFNRRLGAALAASVLLGWSMLACVLLLLMALAGANANGLFLTSGLCSLFGLPLVGALLRDFARDDERRRAGVASWFAFTTTVSVVGAYALHRAFGLPYWPTLIVSANALGAALAMWRWRRMLRAPVAFPACRLA
jgi:hypothetical protein